jgi:uncharacterized membrane protein YkvA (DUF1232 family)
VTSTAVQPGVWTRLKDWARRLKRDTYALYLATRDPRTPLHAKLFAALVAAYAFSPFDLIPDFIPVLGYLDDVILVPLGIYIAVRMIPAEVMADCRRRAETNRPSSKPKNWVAGGLMIALWIACAVICLRIALHWAGAAGLSLPGTSGGAG